MPSPVPLIFLALFLVWLQAFFQASAQMPTRGIYSDVTLPYLTLWGGEESDTVALRMEEGTVLGREGGKEELWGGGWTWWVGEWAGGRVPCKERQVKG